MPGAGATNHARSFGQSNCRPGRARESLRSLRQQLQSSFEIGAERIHLPLDRGQGCQDGRIVSRSRGLKFLAHPVG